MPRASYHSVFISPHIDDVVFSCGGALAQASRDGKALVVSVFSDYGPDTRERKAQDKAASRLFGYEGEFLDLPDLPQRNFWGRLPHSRHRFLNKNDQPWIAKVGERLKEFLQNVDYQNIYFPLGAGFHVDHEICFQAALRFPWRGNLRFYEDVPYVLGPGVLEERLFYLLGNIHRLEERIPVLHLEHTLDPLVRFLWTRPGLSRPPLKSLRWSLHWPTKMLLHRRFRRIKFRQRPHPDLHLKPHYISIQEHFELKMQKIWTFESQAKLFFNSPEEARMMLIDHHQVRNNGHSGLYERFWIR